MTQADPFFSDTPIKFFSFDESVNSRYIVHVQLHPGRECVTRGTKLTAFQRRLHPQQIVRLSLPAVAKSSV